MDEKLASQTKKMSTKNGLVSYVTGFVMSLALTLVAYQLVQAYARNAPYSRNTMLLAIAGLAIVQLFVQLVFFLHVGSEGKPRWNLMMLLFAGMVVVILVAGSMWIMHNLDYKMTSPPMNTKQVNNYLDSQDGL